MGATYVNPKSNVIRKSKQGALAAPNEPATKKKRRRRRKKVKKALFVESPDLISASKKKKTTTSGEVEVREPDVRDQRSPEDSNSFAQNPPLSDQRSPEDSNSFAQNPPPITCRSTARARSLKSVIHSHFHSSTPSHKAKLKSFFQQSVKQGLFMYLEFMVPRALFHDAFCASIPHSTEVFADLKQHFQEELLFVPSPLTLLATQVYDIFEYVINHFARQILRSSLYFLRNNEDTCVSTLCYGDASLELSDELFLNVITFFMRSHREKLTKLGKQILSAKGTGEAPTKAMNFMDILEMNSDDIRRIWESKDHFNLLRSAMKSKNKEQLNESPRMFKSFHRRESTPSPHVPSTPPQTT
eukprot:Nk52_evm1s1507 gene=Nk52_evmTU1s1507